MVSVPLPDVRPTPQHVLDFTKFFVVHVSITVEVEHLERHLEMARRGGQHRQQK
jgi:hypothetical protein